MNQKSFILGIVLLPMVAFALPDITKSHEYKDKEKGIHYIIYRDADINSNIFYYFPDQIRISEKSDGSYNIKLTNFRSIDKSNRDSDGNNGFYKSEIAIEFELFNYLLEDDAKNEILTSSKKPIENKDVNLKQDNLDYQLIPVSFLAPDESYIQCSFGQNPTNIVKKSYSFRPRSKVSMIIPTNKEMNAIQNKIKDGKSITLKELGVSCESHTYINVEHHNKLTAKIKYNYEKLETMRSEITKKGYLWWKEEVENRSIDSNKFEVIETEIIMDKLSLDRKIDHKNYDKFVELIKEFIQKERSKMQNSILMSTFEELVKSSNQPKQKKDKLMSIIKENKDSNSLSLIILAYILDNFEYSSVDQTLRATVKNKMESNITLQIQEKFRMPYVVDIHDSFKFNQLENYRDVDLDIDSNSISKIKLGLNNINKNLFESIQSINVSIEIIRENEENQTINFLINSSKLNKDENSILIEKDFWKKIRTTNDVSRTKYRYKADVYSYYGKKRSFSGENFIELKSNDALEIDVSGWLNFIKLRLYKTCIPISPLKVKLILSDRFVYSFSLDEENNFAYIPFSRNSDEPDQNIQLNVFIGNDEILNKKIDDIGKEITIFDDLTPEQKAKYCLSEK